MSLSHSHDITEKKNMHNTRFSFSKFSINKRQYSIVLPKLGFLSTMKRERERRCNENRAISDTDTKRRKKMILDLLPIELIMEILKRVPVETLTRFLCVSKLWASIIRRPYFMKLYLTESANRPGRFFISAKRDEDSVFFSSLQTQNPGEASVAATYITTHPSFSRTMNSSNVHGLICYETTDSSSSELVVYNSSTRRSVTLPRFGPGSSIVSHLLGYDPVDGVYKVLCMTRPRTGPRIVFQVLPLGNDGNSWRKMIETCPTHSTAQSHRCINGVLYFEAKVEIGLEKTAIVMSFDVRSEKFHLIKRPCNPEIYKTMVSYEGKLAIASSEIFKSGRVVMWVLEDAVKHEWSEKVFILPHSWTRLVQGSGTLPSFHRLVDVTDAGELLLSPILLVDTVQVPFYVLYYDPQRNSVRRVRIQGITNHKLLPPKTRQPYISHFHLFSSQLESLMLL